jgi:Fe-S-cluster containining protein
VGIVLAEADRILEGHGCSATAECCHFARTGREPSVTEAEWREIERAVLAQGRKLPGPPTDPDRTCSFLGADQRCTIYESRPLGCRSYFCHRHTGPGPVPREALASLVAPLRELAETLAPDDPSPRPLSGWLRIAAKQR